MAQQCIDLWFTTTEALKQLHWLFTAPARNAFGNTPTHEMVTQRRPSRRHRAGSRSRWKVDQRILQGCSLTPGFCPLSNRERLKRTLSQTECAMNSGEKRWRLNGFFRRAIIHSSVANFLDDRSSVELASSLPSHLDELLKRPEFGRELTFADHVDQFYACQDRCGWIETISGA